MIHFILKIKKFKVDLPIFFLLFFFISFHILSFFNNPTSYINIRLFFETYGWGFILFFIFFNEINESNFISFANVICWITSILSLYVILEYIFKINPATILMKYYPLDITNYYYITPEMAEKAGGVYRPYGPFFSPSGVGTFIAMGIPFLIFKIKMENPKSSNIFKLIISILAIIVNYTRGVWVSLAISSIFYIKKLRKFLPLFIFLGFIGLYTIILFLKSHPFFKRLLDPTNLLARVAYWEISFYILSKKFLIGVGHLNFKEYYFKFIDAIKQYSNVDFKEVFVADNAYLTTFVEHGLLGFLSFITLFVTFLKKFKKTYIKFMEKSPEKAAFIEAVHFSLMIYLMAGLLADVNLFLKCTKYLFIILGAGYAIVKNLNKELDS